MTDKEESFFRKRITELRDICFQRNITMRLSAGGVRMVTAGGLDDAERRVVFFLPAYLEEIPDDVLCYLKIAPAAPKFADALTHRDFLGALMSLGIRREMLGDICIDGSTAHLIALSSVADTICRELTSVKHTSVSVTPEGPEDLSLGRFPLRGQDPSHGRKGRRQFRRRDRRLRYRFPGRYPFPAGKRPVPASAGAA